MDRRSKLYLYVRDMLFLLKRCYNIFRGELLPYDSFAWVTDPERFLDPKIWDTLSSTSETGYYLDVDIKIPKKNHTKIAHRCHMS